jgi:3-methylcrotonyl-CoA carboxylase alpha subunit
MFERVLIANRGEIACRIIATCRRLGVEAIAVYSDADAGARHVRLADRAVHIGGPRPIDSYLRADTIVQAARDTGARAVHPGYGFLSENAGFARALDAAGIAFVGPNLAAIEAMGSKAEAKALMQRAGVPLVPGYHGEAQEADHLAEQASAIGFPLMIKAAAGGGGKGMRIVRTADEFAAALASAQRESGSAFGDARMILERYLPTPRHIEFQVFGDRHGSIIHLGERECSAQRRYQKVLEETPSPFLDHDRRAAMGAAAVAAARAVDYVGAGTVEFIVGADGAFFFMEMNTRLQVEHPVTELVTGLDLVEWQLRVAAGEPLPLAQDQVASRGHSIELRLYAEDPEQNFMPGSGRLERLRLPVAEPGQVRIDAGVDEGDTVSIFYDPMIAKLIVWDRDRPAALLRLREALAACDIVGPKSNIAFLEALVRHPVVVEGRIDTGYLDRHLDEFLGDAGQLPDAALLAVAVADLLAGEDTTRTAALAGPDPHSPWARADGWRLGHAGRRALAFDRAGARIDLSAHGSSGHYRIEHEGRTWQVADARYDGEWLSWREDGQARRLRVLASGADWLVFLDGRRFRLHEIPAYAWTPAATGPTNRVLAPMPGRIVAVKTRVGAVVEAEAELLVMEAMKMELTLRAPRGGTIEALSCAEGDFVEADAVLVRFAEE